MNTHPDKLIALDDLLVDEVLQDVLPSLRPSPSPLRRKPNILAILELRLSA